MGNKFLSNIRECDAIVHVVRCFKDDNVIHVNGKVDPVDDMDVINLELVFADLEQVRVPGACGTAVKRATGAEFGKGKPLMHPGGARHPCTQVTAPPAPTTPCPNNAALLPRPPDPSNLATSFLDSPRAPPPSPASCSTNALSNEHFGP